MLTIVLTVVIPVPAFLTTHKEYLQVCVFWYLYATTANIPCHCLAAPNNRNWQPMCRGLGTRWWTGLDNGQGHSLNVTRHQGALHWGILCLCFGNRYSIYRPWQLICVLILVTAMFVLLFRLTALVFTMCLVTVSDIGIVTVWCNLFFILSSYIHVIWRG